MKIQPQLIAALAALLITSNALPVYAANVDRPPEATASLQNNALISDGAPPEEWETVTSGNPCPSSGDTPVQEPSAAGAEGSGMTVPDVAPVFSAHVAYSPHGFVVKVTSTEFLPGTSLVQPLYSLDGEVWQTCQIAWIKEGLGSETEKLPEIFQNQICLHDGFEPLSGYIAGQFNRFYLKLQITLENGLTYETQTAVIDRGDPLMIPEELTPVAGFTSAMRILQRNPFKLYGQYQITVSADATPEDISALLPDTLPMEVQLFAGNKIVTKAIVDCPITWKPLSLPRLTAGESVTIADAAEEIIVPAGTLLHTPTGIFQLSEPLGIAQDDIVQNEIRVVLNVVAENADPTGVLAGYNDGLEVAFHLKPTGATAIRAYTLSEGEENWVELPDSLRLEEVNAPSSIANSTYTFVLRNTSEPYHSYLAAWNAGDEPVPFLVGLKVEGGVYDGRQLILAWPDTYERLTALPDLKGHGGNESNAGSDNKNDSTPEGQRPGLLQDPEDRPDTQEPEPPQNPKDKQDPNDKQNTQETNPPQGPNDKQNTQEMNPPQDPNDKQNTQEPEPPQNPKDKQDPNDKQNTQESETPQDPKGEQNVQGSELQQIPEDEQNAHNPELQQTSEYQPEAQQPASHIPEPRPERQSDLSQAPRKATAKTAANSQGRTENLQTEPLRLLEEGTDGHMAGSNDSFMQIAIAETMPVLIAEIGNLISAPAAGAEAGSPAWEKYAPGTEHSLHKLLLPAAAAIAIGICIAAAVGKATEGSIFGKIFREIKCVLHRFLQLK